jgi:hypothetical protein
MPQHAGRPRFLPSQFFISQLPMTLAIDVGVAPHDRTALTRQIEALIARLNPKIAIERRSDERIAIPIVFRLTPLDLDRMPIESEATTVVGKNLSRRGMSFFHERPLPHRRAVLALIQPGLGDFAAEIDVRWCRFTRPGWYESGGRLVRAAATADHLAAYPLLDIESPQAPGIFTALTRSPAPN